MQRRILAVLDGSSLGEAVLPDTVALARATCSSVTLLQVLLPTEVAQQGRGAYLLLPWLGADGKGCVQREAIWRGLRLFSGCKDLSSTSKQWKETRLQRWSVR